MSRKKEILKKKKSRNLLNSVIKIKKSYKSGSFDAVALTWSLLWGTELRGGAALAGVNVGVHTIFVNDDLIVGEGAG